MKYLVCLIVWLVTAKPMISQGLSYVNLNLENGVPSNETYRVTQDNKGFIWICTDHGVVRYDGQTFETFSTSNGLMENTVFGIYQDYKNRLWFLGMSGTLCYWVEDTIIHHPANANIKHLLNFQSSITNMAVDSNDVLYFTKVRTNITGYYSVGVTDTIIYFTPLEEQDLMQSSLLLLNERTNLLLTRAFTLQEEKAWDGAIKEQVFPIVDIADYGIIFREYQPVKEKQSFFREDTVFIYDQKLDTVILLDLMIKDKRIHSVYLDSKEQLWVSTNQGIFFFGEAPYINKKPQLFFENISIATINEDNQGNYWLATLKKGVLFISNWDIRHFFKGQLPIMKLATVGNQIFGVSDENLYRLNDKYPFNEELIAVNGGVHLYDIKEWKEKLVLSNSFIIEIDKNNLIINEDYKTKSSVGKTLFIDNEQTYIMVGCSEGAFIIDKDSVENIKEKYWINAIEEKTKDEWFWGTTEGLCYYNKVHHKTTNLGKQNHLLLQSVLDLVYFQGNLVVATKGNGVLLLDPKTLKVLNQWTSSNGLSSVFVHCLTVENDSTIWVGTNQGANRLVVSENEIKSTTLFDVHNYLPSNGVNGMLIKDSILWFATDNGIARVPQKLLYPSKYELDIPIYIKAVRINGTAMVLKDNYSLAYNQNNIVIDFLALSFNVANSMSYRYQLQNSNKLSDHWIYTKQPHINCNNLVPDRYTLTIEVKPKNGEWQKNGAQLHFEISPHFTETWSFAFLIISGLCLIVAVFIYYLIRKKNIEKELAEAEQKSLRSQLKPHFLFNAINSVVYFLYKNQKKQALKFLQKFAALMRSTLENTQQPLIFLDQDIKHLQLYLDMEYERLSSGSDYNHEFSIKVSENLNIQQWKVPPMLIQPLVENAIIHGLAPKEDDRKLLIFLKEVDGGLSIVVEDNGIGRTAAKEIKKQFFVKKTSQGLKMLNQRIKTIYKLLNIQIEISVEDVLDNPNCSTRFTVFFPKNLKNNQNA